MRISSSYWERLLYNVLPIPLIIAVVSVIDGAYEYVIVCTIITLILWLIDTLIIYYKFNPKALFISKSTIKIGKEIINHCDIESIGKVKDYRQKWSFTIIKLYLTNGKYYFILPKRKFKLFDSYSKTLDKLLIAQPLLKAKIVKESEI